jgi:hypothetical protein
MVAVSEALAARIEDQLARRGLVANGPRVGLG